VVRRGCSLSSGGLEGDVEVSRVGCTVTVMWRPHKGCAAMVVRMSRMGCAVVAWMLQKGSPEAMSCAVAGPGRIGERRPDPVGRSPILALPAWWWLGGRVRRGDAR
jgi:hypothetical protein